MAAFLEFVFGVQWWVYVATAVYTVIWLLLRDSYKNGATSWKRINGWLMQDKWGTRDRDTLQSILERVDAQLTPEIINKGWISEPKDSARSFGLLKFPFSIAVYDLLRAVMIFVMLVLSLMAVAEWVR